MCYRTQQEKKTKELEKLFNAVARLPEFMNDDDLARFHINGFAKQFFDGGKKMALHPQMLIQPQENPRFLTPVMWGFVPHYVSGERIKEYYDETRAVGQGLNATAEKLYSSSMFMDAAKNRRCIVPVTGFFEPHTTPVKVKGKPFKVPFRFTRKDEKVMRLAGIYEFTHDGHITFSIVTRKATPLFAKIHNTKNRRPVILDEKQADTWLDSGSRRDVIENIIVNDTPDDLLLAQPISKDLYKTSVDTNKERINNTVHYEEIAIDYEGKPKPLDLFS